jgi:hypothetical protein
MSDETQRAHNSDDAATSGRPNSQSAIVRNGTWVMLRDLHLIGHFSAAELEMVRLERARAAHPDEARSIDIVLRRHAMPSTD